MADPAKVADSSRLPSSYDVARVAPAPVAAKAAAAALPVYAVFVAHGMGEQIPFATMDSVAEGLRAADARARGTSTAALPRANVGALTVGKERLRRIELSLQSSGGQSSGGGEREVHVYEGYWAPLTEGQVSLRDVMSFLYDTAWNGISNGSRAFRRWLFGEYRSFVSPVRTILYLLIALAAAASLAAINTAIVAVVAARSPLSNPPRWLGNGLFADLTTTFNLLLFCMLLFAGSLALARWLRGRAPRLRRIAGVASAVLFVIALFAVIAAAAAVLLLLYLHLKSAHGDEALLTDRHPRVAGFDTLFGALLLGLLTVLGLAALLGWFARIVGTLRRELAGSGPGGRWSRLVIAVFALIVVGLGLEVGFFAAQAKALPAIGTWRAVVGAVAWPLLVLVSAFVRKFLIEYLGDVAVYVTSHRLDRFQVLRERIKDCVYRQAHAVYSAGYEKVIVVGHSLGSAVAYDTLNHLILEDEVARQQGGVPLDVVARTPLFLTFGSPLDKFAFLFAVAGKSTTEAREAVVASLQPLIVDRKFRPFDWVNVYSPWDLFSGHLKFYDAIPPPPEVENRVDPNATTLWLAHTEYWANPLIYDVLRGAI
jgi:hypothetical protein